MPHKTKISLETMVKACKDCLAGYSSPNQIAVVLGVASTSVKSWVRRYRSEGVEGLVPQKCNRMYSAELKLQTVTEYLKGEGSLSQLCEKYHIRSKTQLLHWIQQYNRHEEFKCRPGGTQFMTKTRKTTQNERKEIVQYCLAHKLNYGGTAEKYQVSYQQVYQWVQKYKEMGDAGLEDRRGKRIGSLPSRTPEEELRDKVAELERKNHWLQMENDVLKKLKELERRDALAQQGKSGNTKQQKR